MAEMFSPCHGVFQLSLRGSMGFVKSMSPTLFMS